MTVTLRTALPNLDSTLNTDRQGGLRHQYSKSDIPTSRSEADSPGGLLPRSKSAPTLGDSSSRTPKSPRHRAALPTTPQRNHFPAAPDAAISCALAASPGTRLEGSASDSEINHSAFPTSAGVNPYASPAIETSPGGSPTASTSSSTTFDRSGDHVSFRTMSDQSLSSQLVDAAPPGTDTPTRLQTICAFSGPVIDAVAAALSLATSRLSANPLAARLAAVISGSLWAGGAVVNEWGNAPNSKLVTGANAFGGIAGTLSIPVPLLQDQTQRNVAYSSAGAWAANGAADIVSGVGNNQRNLASRCLQVMSGAANITAAGLSAAAADASARDEKVRAANLGAVSGGLWIVGTIAALGSRAAARSDALNSRQPGREPDSAV